MKRSVIHFQLPVLLLLLAGCTQGEPLPGEDTKSLFRVGTLQTATGEGTATRAVTTADYPTGQSIGFFVKADTPNGYDAKNNIKGTYNATTGVWEPATDIWLNNHNATIAVYAPYDVNQSTAAALKLTAALRTDDKKDIWYTRVTDANFKKASLSLTLTHVYARCVITVQRAASYLPDAQITALSLAGTGIYSGATFKLLEASPYDYSGATAGFTPTGVATNTLNNTTSFVNYDLLLIPATLSDNIKLELTVNNQKMTQTIAANKFSGKLEAGKQYAITATLRPGELAASVTVEPWSTTPIDGGTAEYE